MNEIKGSQTESNLMQLIAIESLAIQKYGWFAKIALKEGFKQMEDIFLETAEQKKSHCKTMFRFLEGCELKSEINLSIGPLLSNLENLQAAVKAETEEESSLYAKFEQIAWDEGFKQIATKLKLFRQIKLFYASRFAKLADNIINDEVFKKKKKVKWYCKKCGLIYESERALKNCPGCEHPQAYFEVLAENY